MSWQRGGCTHDRHGDMRTSPTHTAPHTQPSHQLHKWGSYVIQHTKNSLSLNKCQGWQKITMRRKLHHVHPSTLSKQVVNVGSSTSTIDLLDGALPCNPLRNKFIGLHHTHSPHTSYTNEDHVCNSTHQNSLLPNNDTHWTYYITEWLARLSLVWEAVVNLIMQNRFMGGP